MILDATELARDWTARRVAVPLSGSSVALTRDPAFPAAARVNALFVSRVTSANALAALRGQIEGVLAGGTSPARAAQVLRGAFQDDAGAVGLVSPGRAREIVRQQAMQAYAVGERAVALAPPVMEAFPYCRYEATQDGRTRATHRALDGLVLRKDDPFWRTHTPPWEFGCRCALSPVSAAEAQELGVGRVTPPRESDQGQSATVVTAKGATVSLPGNESGYEFDVEGAFRSSDMGQVRELKDRREILGEMVAAARESGVSWRFVARQELADREVLPADIEGIRRAVGGLSAGVREAAARQAAAGEQGPLTDVAGPAVELGRLLPEHADALGIRPEESRVSIPVPGSSQSGVRHWSVRHARDLADPERLLDLLGRTLWNPGARAWIDVAGPDTVRLMLGSRARRSVATFFRRGAGWELEAASAVGADPRYMDSWKPRKVVQG